MSTSNEIEKKYVSLDQIFLEFAENIDYIPLFISQNEINIEEMDSQEYINVSDYKKIKNSLYLKRNNKEITINSNLIGYSPSNND